MSLTSANEAAAAASSPTSALSPTSPLTPAVLFHVGQTEKLPSCLADLVEEPASPSASVNPKRKASVDWNASEQDKQQQLQAIRRMSNPNNQSEQSESSLPTNENHPNNIPTPIVAPIAKPIDSHVLPVAILTPSSDSTFSSTSSTSSSSSSSLPSSSFSSTAPALNSVPPIDDVASFAGSSDFYTQSNVVLPQPTSTVDTDSTSHELHSTDSQSQAATVHELEKEKLPLNSTDSSKLNVNEVPAEQDKVVSEVVKEKEVSPKQSQSESQLHEQQPSNSTTVEKPAAPRSHISSIGAFIADKVRRFSQDSSVSSSTTSSATSSQSSSRRNSVDRGTNANSITPVIESFEDKMKQMQQLQARDQRRGSANKV